MTATKINSRHLKLEAWAYIRQSTSGQVEKNWGSTERQYDLRERAVSLGWPPSQVKVVDDDLAQSGKTADGRTGFEKLVMAVSLREVGAVLCRDVARVARGNYEWQHLLRLCVLTDTLIIDDDAVYDPKIFADSLVLNIKGIMSEAELHSLHQRNIGGRIQKALKGEYRVRLPTGLVYTAEHTVIFDPSPGVQEAIHLFFQKFTELGSARQVVRYFTSQQRLCTTSEPVRHQRR